MIFYEAIGDSVSNFETNPLWKHQIHFQQSHPNTKGSGDYDVRAAVFVLGSEAVSKHTSPKTNELKNHHHYQRPIKNSFDAQMDESTTSFAGYGETGSVQPSEELDLHLGILQYDRGSSSGEEVSADDYEHEHGDRELAVVPSNPNCPKSCNNNCGKVAYNDPTTFRKWIKDFQDKVIKDCSISCFDTSDVTDMSEAFNDVPAINCDLSLWNTASVTNMKGMFSGASAFNQPVDGWDVSKVRNMNGMFLDASAFNQPVDGWDVYEVTNMEEMFSGAYAFNQPVDDWDVSKVTNMEYMFRGANAFNQPVDDWDVSKVTNLRMMF